MLIKISISAVQPNANNIYTGNGKAMNNVLSISTFVTPSASTQVLLITNQNAGLLLNRNNRASKPHHPGTSAWFGQTKE